MENPGNNSDFKNFVEMVVVIDVGLLLIAGVIVISKFLSFSIALFGLGILSTVIGAYLGGPNRFDPKNPGMSLGNPYEYPTAGKLRARIMHAVKNSVPSYSIENALVLAGLIAIVLSLPFICQIMF